MPGGWRPKQDPRKPLASAGLFAQARSVVTLSRDIASGGQPAGTWHKVQLSSTRPSWLAGAAGMPSMAPE